MTDPKVLTFPQTTVLSHSAYDIPSAENGLYIIFNSLNSLYSLSLTFITKLDHFNQKGSAFSFNLCSWDTKQTIIKTTALIFLEYINHIPSIVQRISHIWPPLILAVMIYCWMKPTPASRVRNIYCPHLNR